MPAGKLSSPPRCPAPFPPLQTSTSSWQTSKPVLAFPLMTSLPHIRSKAPVEENFWTRLPFESVTYKDPAPSTATPIGRFISPWRSPLVPTLQVSTPARQISNPVLPPLITSLPHVRIGTPSSSNFWMRWLPVSRSEEHTSELQ